MKKLTASVIVLSFAALALACDKDASKAPTTPSATPATTAPASGAPATPASAKAGSGW